MGERKFKVKTLKYTDQSVPKGYTEVESVTFFYKGVEFAYPKNKEDGKGFQQILHVRSGFGFNGIIGKNVNRKNCEQHIDACIDRVGEEKFWETIAKTKDLDESIVLAQQSYDQRINFSPRRDRFQEITGITVPIDGLLSLGFGAPQIDLPALDDNLKRRYPDEYPDGVSMAQFIKNKWGEQAVEIIEKLIGKYDT